MSDEPQWSSSRAPILAVVAAVAVLIIVPLASRPASVAPDGITLAVSLGTRSLASGDVVHPGDTLRFSVRTRDGGQVTLVGVDAAGVARASIGPLQLDAGEHALPGDVTLLAAPLGDERYVAFACVLPVASDALLAAAKAERPGVDGCAFDLLTATRAPR